MEPGYWTSMIPFLDVLTFGSFGLGRGDPSVFFLFLNSESSSALIICEDIFASLFERYNFLLFLSNLYLFTNLIYNQSI